MKTVRLSLIALLLLGAISCKKTENNASASVTSDQVADIAAGALAENSNGFATVTDAVAVNAQAVTSSVNGQSVNSVGTSSFHQECGTTLTDSATVAGSNSSVAFNYFVKYSHTLNCNANSQPDNIINDLTYHGDYEGPNITSSNSGTAHVIIAGLTQAAANYVVNGEYKRSGAFTSKVGNKATGNSAIDVIVNDVTLTKPGRKISGGTGTFTVTGSVPKGTFNFTGTILFNGDGTATLTVSGGSTYTVNLLTGTRIKK